MEIRPVRTEADYKSALKEISRLMESDPELGTPDGDRLDVLATLVQAYEARHYPIDLPDPVEAIKFRMEQGGLTPKGLEPMIGKRNRVYEVLNRKRGLTLPMIWRLHTELGIPAESLIRSPAPPSCELSIGCIRPG
ncbi:Predicted transcription regulator containing HTH domain [Bordetella pertussis]|nr:Predicted transcription regulator containing HTH domain [Bordetella pertussis]